MTYNDIMMIAKRLDKDIKEKIDADVDERIEILKEGDLTKEELMKMEECLYMSLVIQEYLNSEAELLDEERILLLAEMEEMYNEYGELLSKAKLEEKLSRKKRMALELRRIREELFNKKALMKRVKKQMQDNQNNLDNMKKLSSKQNMKDIVDKKKELANPDKGLKLGIGGKRDAKEGAPVSGNGTSQGLDKNEVEKIVDDRSAEIFKREVFNQFDNMINQNQNENQNRDLGAAWKDPVKEYVEDVRGDCENIQAGIGGGLVSDMFKEEIDKNGYKEYKKTI